MLYKELVDVYEQLEQTSSKLKKTDILARFFSTVPKDEIKILVNLACGNVFPPYSELELGVATQLMIRAIARATGFDTKEIEREFARIGDLGLVAERCIKSKKQVSLFTKPLTTQTVYDTCEKIARETGEKSQARKLDLLTSLLHFASPKEARYIVRTVIGELRTGVAEGIVRDALVECFLTKPEMSKEERERATEIVENAYNILCDFGEVAEIAMERGIEGLKHVKIKVGRPIKVMLAEKAKNIEDAMKTLGGRVAIEIKYDGMRAQIHKSGDKIWIYTRRLEHVTKQFPDLVEYARKNLKCKECVVEGEVWAVSKKDFSPLPFQVLSQRIHRKYKIEKMVEEIPVQINLFDIMYLDGKMVIDLPLKERRKLLERIVNEVPHRFKLATQLVTSDVKEAEKFYQQALELKQEGVMVKNLESKYIFGRRVGGWLKVKPTAETLDLVIVGATWGTGKRAGWLGSFILACRDEATGEFLECGMLGTGIKEKKTSPEDVTFEELTEMLKPYIEFQRGSEVRIRPKIVVSVDYQEIQRSPNYKSGFALRFPRFIAIRFDKNPEDADTLSRLEYLYKLQSRSK